MAWTNLNFGKHLGKSLPQVLFADPDWFFWAYEQGVFGERGGSLSREAEDIYWKARHILIPDPDGKDLVAEYLTHHPTGKFGTMQIVPRKQPVHVGSSAASRSDFIDLAYPRRLAQYDKSGCSMLVKQVKYHLFGKSSVRVTRALAEGFFEKGANFKSRAIS